MTGQLVASIMLVWPFGLGQAAPDVIVHSVDGPKAAAPLLGIDADFTVKLGGKEPLTIAGGDLVALRRVGLPQPASCPPPFLQLTSGDRLPLAVPLKIELADETLRVALAAPVAMVEYSVPQAAVARLALTSADEPAGKNAVDGILLKNGDRLAGKLGGIDPKTGATLVVAGDAHTIALDRIAQIAFNPEFQTPPRAKGPHADVILSGGARLSLAKVAKVATVGPGGQLSGVSLFGHIFGFQTADVVALRIRQGKAVYLDEIKPKTYDATPFLDVAWPLAMGRTVLGGPLKIGDDFHSLGLGMHSRSKATYALDERDRWFEAIVAIDSAAGPRAAARIDVELDGKPVAGFSRLMKAGDIPLVLRVDLKDAKSLTLVTDFGPRGDIQGHAIWADARIVRK